MFVCQSAHDNPGSGGRTRVLSEAGLLRKNNIPVAVITFVQPSKFKKPVALLKARKQLARDAAASVTYIPKLPTFENAILIALGMAWMRLALRVYNFFYRARVMHCHGLSSGELVQGLRSRKSIRLLLDVHGLGAEEESYTKSAPILIRRIENEVRLLHQADWIFFVSESMHTYYCEKGFTGNSFSIVPCLARRKSIPAGTELLQSTPQFPLNNTNSKLIFVYSGSYRKYQKAEETIRLFTEIKARFSDAFFLLLTGHADAFRKHLTEANLKPDDYLILSLNQSEVHDYLCRADIAFLLRDDTPLNRAASPTKFAEYCMAGLPVLVSEGVGDFTKMAAEEDLGFVLNGFSYSLALEEFINNYRLHRSGYKNRTSTFASTRLSWEGAEADYISNYRKLLS